MKLDDVILVLEMTSPTARAFYDLVTHEITWLDEYMMTQREYEAAYEILDEHGFVRLPEQHDINEYGMMKDFDYEHNSDELFDAIDGRGAFRRFKSAIRRLDLDQEWYQFRDAQYKRIAIEWCEEHGITLDAVNR